MHVKALIAEQASAPRQTILEPTWDQVLAAIRMLDGQGRTTVVLECSAEDYMTVAGGNKRFLCEIYKEFKPGDFRFWTLCDSGSESDEPTKMMVGAEIFVPRRNCVPLQAAEQAAQTYYERGIADDALLWQDG